MGKVSPIPRLTYWYSKENKEYIYSGIKVLPVPYTEVIKRLCDLVEKQCDYKFNSVLLNLYRDGNDKVAWHADDEKSLGDEINIASISVGAEREFQFKSKHDPEKKEKIMLSHGSLLIMHDPLQQHWLHQIPVRKRFQSPGLILPFDLFPKCLPMSIFNQNIFKDIILSIKDKFDIAGEDNFTDFIRSYKKDLFYLHSRINKGNVRIDYSNERLQLVYVLKYMHAYWYQIFAALQFIKDECEDDLRNRLTNSLRFGLYAAGPAPELIGIYKFLSDKSFLNSQDRSKIKNNNIEVHLLDKVKDGILQEKHFFFLKAEETCCLMTA